MAGSERQVTHVVGDFVRMYRATPVVWMANGCTNANGHKWIPDVGGRKCEYCKLPEPT